MLIRDINNTLLVITIVRGVSVGNNINNLVSEYIEELATKSGPDQPGKPITFSIRLSEQEHAKLLWLAKSLDTPKTPLAEKLLKAAVEEATVQYARLAEPDDPEGFLKQIRVEFDNLRSDSGTREQTRPAGPKSRVAVVSGLVSGWKRNHHGDADGLYLSDGTEVKFPPHRARDVLEVVQEGAAVEAEGEWHKRHFHAYVIRDTASGSSVEAHKAPGR
jgi:hypothetical protein